MESIRVLHNIASLHFGGSQAFVMNIYNNIDREKVQFDFVVTPEERKGLYSQVEQMGGRIFVCPKYTGKNHFAYCKWWDDFFTEHPEYHVIHGHVRSTASIYLKIAKKHGLVTIAHSHSTSNGSGISAIVKDMLRLPIRHTADYLFACSDKAGKWLYGEKATEQPNYRMIPNGIDLQRFAFDEEKRRRMRQELGISDNTFVIGHVGRMTTPKNHRFLVELFAEYHKKNQNSRLLLVGDGELFEEVKQQCNRLGISDSVIMTGSKTNTEDYYQAMDVFVFPSLWEGLGIVAIEAQANGLVCLVSDRVPKDVLLTKKCWVLPLGKKETWCDALEQCKFEKHVFPMSCQLYRYDVAKIAEKMQKFYLSL